MCIGQTISGKEIFHIFRFIIVRCRMILNASNSVQYFRSMNYPDKYPNNQDCEWEIHPSIGYYVILTFEDFQLEKIYFDYVELSENKRHIARLCSTDGLNKTYRSYASRMLIKFHSGSVNSYRGFKASYKQGVCKLCLSILPVCYV